MAITPKELERASHDLGYAIGVLSGLADTGEYNARIEACLDEVTEGLRKISALLTRECENPMSMAEANEELRRKGVID
jgi:hypothetical protein